MDEARTVNRAEVREIADLYLARLDERLERRLGEFKAEFKAELKADLATLRVEMKDDLAGLRVETKDGLAALRVETADRHKDVLRWLFIFWAGTLIPLAGLFVALAKL